MIEAHGPGGRRCDHRLPRRRVLRVLRLARRVRWGLLLSDLAFVGLVLAMVFVAWPARLGGRAVLVVVHGSSMEPTYHGGDLLYARTTDRYDTGQAAVFQLPEGEPGAGQLVVHRIQGRTDDGRYIMQGDNRPLDDGALPTARDMVARPVADLGPVPVTALRLIPWAALLVVGATVGWYLWTTADEAPARRRPAPPLRPAGVDLRGSWALVRDASAGDAPLPPPAGPDPFAPGTAPLGLGDLLRFMGAADQAAA